jgi:hypothetical protein
VQFILRKGGWDFKQASYYFAGCPFFAGLHFKDVTADASPMKSANKKNNEIRLCI